MTIEIRVPTLGESVTEATVGKWFKKTGDAVKADEPLVELETDKVTVEVPAPASGVMGEISSRKARPLPLVAARCADRRRCRRCCQARRRSRAAAAPAAAPAAAAAPRGTGSSGRNRDAAEPGRPQGAGRIWS